MQTALKQGVIWSISRLTGAAEGGSGADVSFRATTSLVLNHADKRKLLEATRGKPLQLSARTLVGDQSATHQIQLVTQEKTFPGWLAIDFGTSSSSVTIYDNRKNITAPGLPAEQEAELKQQLEKVLTSPPPGISPEQWDRFLDQIDQNLSGSSLREAFRHGDEPARYQALRQLEIQVANLPDSAMRNHVNNWLYDLYHEALRVPPLSKLSLHPVELEAAGGETEIPSELRIDRLDEPLQVTMGAR